MCRLAELVRRTRGAVPDGLEIIDRIDASEVGDGKDVRPVVFRAAACPGAGIQDAPACIGIGAERHHHVMGYVDDGVYHPALAPVDVEVRRAHRATEGTEEHAGAGAGHGIVCTVLVNHCHARQFARVVGVRGRRSTRGPVVVARRSRVVHRLVTRRRRTVEPPGAVVAAGAIGIRRAGIVAGGIVGAAAGPSVGVVVARQVHGVSRRKLRRRVDPELGRQRGIRLGEEERLGVAVGRVELLLLDRGDHVELGRPRIDRVVEVDGDVGVAVAQVKAVEPDGQGPGLADELLREAHDLGLERVGRRKRPAELAGDRVQGRHAVIRHRARAAPDCG